MPATPERRRAVSRAPTPPCAAASAGPAVAAETLIGLDWGSRRIGVAVGERGLGRARPLGTVANRSGTPDWAMLDTQVAEWRPDAFVVGWPCAPESDDEGGPGTARRDGHDAGRERLLAEVRGFARRLRRRYALPVHALDERFSSVEAGRALAAMRRRGQRRRRVDRGDVDAVAAALILERWFAADGRVDPAVTRARVGTAAVPGADDGGPSS